MATVAANLPEGVFSLLDTDLYKLTMQCCILKYFPDVSVTYSFTNRTPDKKLNRAAFHWLQAQVDSMYCSMYAPSATNRSQSSKTYT
jgi:nicotinate phosphoribosyltransferase